MKPNELGIYDMSGNVKEAIDAMLGIAVYRTEKYGESSQRKLSPSTILAFV